MKEIKEWALVKAWNSDSKDFSIGCYDGIHLGKHIIKDLDNSSCAFDNAIEIPLDLVEKLEKLGEEDE